MTFIDFQKQTECCQSQFNENVPSKSINRKIGAFYYPGLPDV